CTCPVRWDWRCALLLALLATWGEAAPWLDHAWAGQPPTPSGHAWIALFLAAAFLAGARSNARDSRDPDRRIPRGALVAGALACTLASIVAGGALERRLERISLHGLAEIRPAIARLWTHELALVGPPNFRDERTTLGTSFQMTQTLVLRPHDLVE